MADAREHARREVIRYCLRMQAEHLVYATAGNISRRVDDEPGVVAMTPTGYPYELLEPNDICIVSTDAAEPITTELLRYGQRVSVVGIRCHPLLASSEALAVVGPGAFGYDVPYAPLEPGGPLPWTTLEVRDG